MESKVLDLSSKRGFVDKNLKILTIKGSHNKIILKSQIDTLLITGINNEIDGLAPNCLIKNIFITGDYNEINLNRNCIINVIKDFKGNGNRVNFYDALIRNNETINTGENLLNIRENNNRRKNLVIVSKVITYQYIGKKNHHHGNNWNTPNINQNTNKNINRYVNQVLIPTSNG